MKESSNPPVVRRMALFILLDAALAAGMVFGVILIIERAGLPVSVAPRAGELVLTRTNAPQLHKGDTLTAINGRAVETIYDVEFICDGMSVGAEVQLSIERGGRSRIVATELVRYYNNRYVLIAILVGAIYFLLGLYVLAQRYNDNAARLFYWATTAAAIVITTTWGSYAVEPIAGGMAVRALYSIAYAFVPVLFLHFTFVFPVESPSPLRKVLPWLYAAPVALSIWMITGFHMALDTQASEWMQLYHTGFIVAQAFLALCVGLAVINSVRTYRAARDEFNRRPLRIVLLGLSVGSLSFVVLWVIPGIFGAPAPVAEEIVVALTALLPISFAVAIGRYRLMNIDVFIRRSAIYAGALGVVFIAYALIIGGAVEWALQSFAVPVDLSPSIAATVMAALVAALFGPVRERVRTLVDRYFYRVQYDFRQEQRAFIEQIRRSLDLRELTELVTKRMDGILAPQKIGFFLVEQPGDRLRLYSHKNFALLKNRSVRFNLAQLQANLRLPVALPEAIEPGALITEGDRSMFSRWGLAVAVALLTEKDSIVGFFTLGQKRSGSRYSAEDLDLLNAVMTQVGLAIERLQLQRKLILERTETERLKELNHLKSYFVSSVSHELKTPLTSIRMFADMLRSRQDLSREKNNEYLDIIEGESERLTRLINNVLDFANIEQGSQRYAQQEVELCSVVEEALNIMQYQLQMQGFTVNKDCGDKDIVVSADRDAVLAATLNLLSNALKYSTTDKRIDISVSKHDAHIALAVLDRGIGVKEEDLAHIFEPFYRSDDTGASQAGGAGLGLALVRHIMEGHGGEAQAHSIYGKGSEFILLFPMRS